MTPLQAPSLPTPAGIDLTRHAAVRVQQRGIPRWFLDVLVEHGRVRHDGHGALVCSIDKAARRRLRQMLSRTRYASAERHFSVYAVISADDAIVTVAHRTRRYMH